MHLKRINCLIFDSRDAFVFINILIRDYDYNYIVRVFVKSGILGRVNEQREIGINKVLSMLSGEYESYCNGIGFILKAIRK